MHFSMMITLPYSWQNWLPRRVMSAWRIAGIVHALEDGVRMSVEKQCQILRKYGLLHSIMDSFH